MLLSSWVRVTVGIRFTVWLVSGYAHVFILPSVVIVTLPFNCTACLNGVPVPRKHFVAISGASCIYAVCMQEAIQAKRGITCDACKLFEQCAVRYKLCSSERICAAVNAIRAIKIADFILIVRFSPPNTALSVRQKGKEATLVFSVIKIP